MCKKCERHELWGGLCLTHLRESLAPVEPKRKPRKKKVDTVEVETNDDTTEMETRESD